MNTRSGIILLAVSLAASAFAPVQDTVDLAFQIKEGAKLTAKSKTTTDLAITGALDQTSKISNDTTQVIEFGAGKDGWFTYSTRTTELKSTTDADLGGQDMDAMMESMKQVVVKGELDLQGNTRNLKLDGPAEATAQMMMELNTTIGFLGLILPKAPAKVGDTWTSESDIKPVEGGMMSPTGGKTVQNYKIESIEVVDGKTFAKIIIDTKTNMTIEGPTGAGTVVATGQTVVLFDVAAGMVKSAEGTATSTADLGVVAVTSKVTSKTEITAS